jgi:ribosomal protein L31
MATKTKTNSSVVTYTSKATAKCLNCGSIYHLGMTSESLNLEICANCHPFYTGEDTVIDTAGRIEKFQTRQNKAVQKDTSTSKSKGKQRKLRTAGIEFNPELGETTEITDNTPEVAAAA